MSNRIEEGKALELLGSVYRDIGNLPKAMLYLEKALEIYRSACRGHEVASVCGNLASTYMKSGNLQEVLKHSYKSLHASTQMEYRVGEIQALATTGTALQILGDYPKAVEYHDKCRNFSRDSGRKDTEASSCAMLGKDHELLNDLETAQGYYFNSINLYEEIHKDIGNRDESKFSFGEMRHAAYQSLSRLLIRRDKPEEALVIVERGRGRALADLMRINYQVQDSRNAQGKPLDAGEIKKTVNECGISTIVTSSLFDGSLSFWVVQPNGGIQLRKPPGQTSLKLGNDGLTSPIDGMYKEIHGPEEEMQCEDRSLTVLYGDQKQRKGRARSRDNDLLVKSLGSKINTSERVHQQQGRRATDCSERNQSHLRRVYDIVIAPVVDLLQGPEVIIVPDDYLHLVPMAALKDERDRFFTESFRIRVLPSLKIMTLIQSSPPEYHSKSGALIVGDPNVSALRLQNLPFARREAEMIGGLLNVTPLIGDQATKGKVLKQMTTVALIHIAAHGDMESGEIALAPNPTRISQIPKKEDFLLSMSDVHNARLRAKLVVLSCCHSGRGKIKAEGVVGIARAFLGAGARSVLVSLWAVDDEATMMFMRSFYEHLHGDSSASEALHQAMKCLRESPQFNDVKYWAPFVLVGDDVKLMFK